MKKTKEQKQDKKKSKTVTYVKESIGELKKVSWPHKSEVVNSTIIVITLIIIISLILSVFDIGVGEVVKYLFKPAVGSMFTFLLMGLGVS